MKDDVILQNKNSIFSNKIKIEYLTPQTVPRRLEQPDDEKCLSFPFVFTPARKNCFSQLLRLPKGQITVIEGVSQTGKSNFACHLTMMYRMNPQSCYIH